MEKRLRRRDKNAERLVDDIIIALCADYDRRKCAIRENSVSRRVRMEYLYINTRMFSAASEAVGHSCAEKLIYEIGKKVGYANSELEHLSELSYKAVKQRAKRRIARELYLE